MTMRGFLSGNITAAAVLVTALAASAAGTAVAATAASGREVPRVNVHPAGCPRGTLPLQPDGAQRAANAALAEAARLYHGLNTRDAEVMASDRSSFAGARGSEVTHLCGPRVAARTVVVQLLFPRMLPSASLSEGVVFAARFPHGYRVWYVAH
jgi:hypothetical protein